MNVLTLPRKAAVLEYRALTLPARLVETQAVVRLLADDSALRLSYERALGAADETVGRLLGDESLQQRGAALRRRTEVLERAVRLEELAEQKRSAAQADLEQETDEASTRRRQAAEQAGRKAAQARKDEAAAAQRVARETAAREKAEKARIQAAAKDRADAAAKAAKAERDRIAAQEKAVTSAPAAQLDGAVADQAKADETRGKADRLARLAAQENLSRQQERQARAGS